MKGMFFEPGCAPEIIDTEDFEEELGGAVEQLWPMREPGICFVALYDRDEMQPNRVVNDMTIRGPFLVVGCHDDFDDLTDEEMEMVEALADWAEEEYDLEEEPDPFEEDAQEEEEYGGVRIVDEDTFYRSLMKEPY